MHNSQKIILISGTTNILYTTCKETDAQYKFHNVLYIHIQYNTIQSHINKYIHTYIHTYIFNISLVVPRIVSREGADGRRGRLVGQSPLVELLRSMALLHHALRQPGQGTVLIQI